MVYLFVLKKMPNYIDPKILGLSARLTLEEIDSNAVAIVINRKSRIIMADGKKILANAEKIKKARPGCTVMLECTAPVCSKTLKYLAEQGITLIEE